MSLPEDNESDLTKLLRCKRYEQPPPGYFLSFSEKVIARIEAEDALEGSSWWTWLVDRFDARPVLACAYGLAVSSLLLVGFRLSQSFEAEVAAGASVGGPWLAAGPASPLLPEALGHREMPGGYTATSYSGTRMVFREEPTQLVFPTAMKSAAFSFGAH